MGASGKNLDISIDNEGSGIKAQNMYGHLNEIQANVRNNNKEAVNILQRIQDDPDAMVTIYKATSSGSINHGDWVFLDKKHADRWTKTTAGATKKGFHVVQKVVHADELEWTKRNLEFLFK